MAYSDLATLDVLIAKFSVKKVYFLGDLFHSDLNKEWEIFSKWLNNYRSIDFTLVKGNHDIFPESIYSKSNLVVRDEVRIEPFIFTHDKNENDQFYNISGHIHPCVRLKGEARQGLRLPCFYFGERNGLLPAFGKFTGTHPIRIYKDDRVYAIADNKIIRLSA